MRVFLLRLLFAAAVILAAASLVSSGHAQQADQDPAPTAPRKSDPAAVPPQHANDAQMPASGEATTQEAKTFSGHIVKENGQLVLKDPVTKVSYKLDDPSKAKEFVGKQVKVTGKLDMDSNTIRVESIEPI
jgi:hypothetical protein